MEIRDYLRMLRRGWPVILMLAVVGIVLAAGYLALAPKRYEANAVLLVGATSTTSTTDLEQGRQYAQNIAPTFADVIESATLLKSVSGGLVPSRSVADLQTMVTAKARESTSLIDVIAAADNASEAASIANEVARESRDRLPNLTPRDSRPNKTGVVIQLVQDAEVPSRPVRPNPKRVLVIGLIVGSALGLASTIAQQALDTRLRRAEDLRNLTSVPVLAILPRLKRALRNRVVVRDDPASQAVESYRALRTNLVHLESTARRSVLLTGVGHRDDVVVPVNLAWSMAQAGKRVLLVDLDLRQSAVGDLISLIRQDGVSEVLTGKNVLPELVQSTDQPGLDVLVSGSTQRSPSDLLSGPMVEAMLRQAEDSYDMVVLHAPPLQVYTDAAVVSRVAGSTLLTISAGRARAADLEGALAALENVRIEPLGLILVGARTHTGDRTRFRSLTARRGVPVEWDHVDGSGMSQNDARPSVPAQGRGRN